MSERFWQGVPDRNAEGCWLWGGGSHSRGGYGQVAHQYAHRVSWVLHFGAIPEGMEVCHRCDANYPPGDTTYRRCVRPDHLFLGTHADNMADMRAKGRSSGGTHPKGEQNPCSRLSDQQTREIVSRHAAGGTTQARLAEHYGVGRTTIWRVLQGIRRVLQGIR